MDRDSITITINAYMTVDESTAEGCLKLVEIYCNQNRKIPIGHQREDGTYCFNFEEDRTNQ